MSWQECFFLSVLVACVTVVLRSFFMNYNVSYYEMVINKRFKEIREYLKEEVKDIIEELNNDNAR